MDELKLYRKVKIGGYFADVHLKHGFLTLMISGIDTERLAKLLLDEKPTIEPWE